MDLPEPELTKHTYILAIDYKTNDEWSKEDYAKFMAETYGMLVLGLRPVKSKVDKWTVCQFSIDLYDDEVF